MAEGICFVILLVILDLPLMNIFKILGVCGCVSEIAGMIDRSSGVEVEVIYTEKTWQDLMIDAYKSLIPAFLIPALSIQALYYKHDAILSNKGREICLALDMIDNDSRRGDEVIIHHLE